MELNAKSADRNLLLELSGEVDHHGAKDAIRQLELAVDAALPRQLVLDMAGVTFMDSSGIALILRAQQRMQLLDGSLLVCNVPMFALKFKHYGFRGNEVRYIFAGCAVVALIIWKILAIPFIIMAYVAVSMVLMAVHFRKSE